MYKIIKESGSARTGILKLDKYEIKTPALWLGHIPKGKPVPWTHFPIECVLMNSYHLLRNKKACRSVKRDGVHGYLNSFDGPIMLDSGGFLFQKKQTLGVTVESILDFYNHAHADLYVVLDHPIDPNKSEEENIERIKKTLENTRYMLDHSKSLVIIPVVHGYTVDTLDWVISKIKKMIDPVMIGLGSLVPLAKNHASKYGVKKRREYLMIDAVWKVRNAFPKSYLHVFGTGSVLTMLIMFQLGVDSVDNIAWRIKAAYHEIQLPGMGDRVVKKRRPKCAWAKELNWEKYNCSCPICEKHGLEELDKSFELRALHNAWVFQEEALRARRAIEEDRLVEFARERLTGTGLRKVYEYACNTIANG